MQRGRSVVLWYSVNFMVVMIVTQLTTGINTLPAVHGRLLLPLFLPLTIGLLFLIWRARLMIVGLMILILVAGCTVSLSVAPGGIVVNVEQAGGPTWTYPTPTQEVWLPTPTCTSMLTPFITSTRVNLRAGDSTSATVNQVLDTGTRIYINLCDQEDVATGWYRVAQPGGYINDRFVRVSSE